MKISSEFDSGSIEVIKATSATNIQLKLNSDNKACTRQWFHFRLDTCENEAHKIAIINAGKSSFSNALNGYDVLASYDQKHWFRVKTNYDEQTLMIHHTPSHSRVFYAYFVPYGYDRQQVLMTKVLKADFCQRKKLATTVDNQPIDLLIIGEAAAHKKKVWIIGRQHPGETMAQWFIEGLISHLLNKDALVQQLLSSVVLYIVPNMNPDGSMRGNHRTNAAGVNLNRQWHQPSELECPEVYFVRKAMHDTGVDLFLDIHGDEEIPYAFMMGGNSSASLIREADEFKHCFAQSNSDFQTTFDYSNYSMASGTSCCGSTCSQQHHLAKATDYVENQFGCLSLLLELPFKTLPNIEAEGDFDPQQRCLVLGQSILQPIVNYISSK
jgi:murein tripeptide amidase MpaA